MKRNDWGVGRGEAGFGLFRENEGGQEAVRKRKNNYYRQCGMRAVGEKQPSLDRTSQKMVFSGKTQILLKPRS